MTAGESTAGDSVEAEGVATAPRLCDTCGGPRDHWDGSRWRCQRCRRNQVAAATRRYYGTARGMLNGINHKAKKRGHR